MLEDEGNAYRTIGRAWRKKEGMKQKRMSEIQNTIEGINKRKEIWI
jgi:hypothetical protein